ncbi:hypothetical protein GC173_07700, partial [bacterium]|nr:hypothetical protein [bacterium]
MLASRFICSCMIFMSAATAPISAAVGRLAGSDVHHYRMIETIEYRSADGGSKYRSQSSTLITVDRPLRLDLGDGAAYEEKQYLNGGTRIACETEEIGYEYGPYLIGLGEDQTQSSNSTGSGLAL